MSTAHNSGGWQVIPSVGGSVTIYTSPQSNVYVRIVNSEGGTAFVAWYDSTFVTLKGSAGIQLGEMATFGPMAVNDVLNGVAINTESRIVLNEIYAL